MTSARDVCHLSYSWPDSSSVTCSPCRRPASSTQAMAMVCVHCLSGAKVRYVSTDMLYAVRPTVVCSTLYSRASLSSSF